MFVFRLFRVVDARAEVGFLLSPHGNQGGGDAQQGAVINVAAHHAQGDVRRGQCAHRVDVGLHLFDVFLHARHVFRRQCVQHLAEGVKHESLVDEAEVDVVGHCREQGCAYIHEDVEHPGMQKADGASAHLVPIDFGVIISHEGDTQGEADE